MPRLSPKTWRAWPELARNPAGQDIIQKPVRTQSETHLRLSPAGLNGLGWSLGRQCNQRPKCQFTRETRLLLPNVGFTRASAWTPSSIWTLARTTVELS